MGAKLIQYYQYVGDQLGFRGKLLLAQETKIPFSRAAQEPDSETNIKRFNQAILKLTGQLAPKL